MHTDPDVKKLLKKQEDFQWYLNVEKTIKEIQKLKQNFAKAIKLLNIDSVNQLEPVQFLDFAILLAIYYL